MTFDQLVEVVNSPAGIAVLSLAILWAGAKGIWVYGRVHKDAVQREKDRAEEWKELATGGLRIADKAVTKLEKES